MIYGNINKSGSKGTNDYGVDPRGRVTVGLSGFTVLMDAARAGDIKKMESIVRGCENLNAQDVSGATALMYAVLGKNLQAVKFLLAHGANPAISTNKGLAPHQVATNNNLAEIAVILVRYESQSDQTGVAI